MSTKRTYSLDAPDQARLKLARAGIEALLKKHDVAGLVVLHTPGMAEFFYDMSPSYSCAWIDDTVGALRMKSSLADYAGDAEAQRNDQAATAQLVHAFAEQACRAGVMFTEVSKIIDQAAGVIAHSTGELQVDPLEGIRQ